MGRVLHRHESDRVSIRRRVVDAAELQTAFAWKLLTMFQSAAASWTRRNGATPTTVVANYFVSIRRRVVDAAECSSSTWAR